MRKLGSVLGLIALLSLTVPTAQAVLIVNTTQGVTLFEHDMENGAPGADPTTAAPAVGSWVWGPPKGAGGATYSNAEAYEGAQSIEMTDGLGYLAAMGNGPSDPGDVIEVSYAFRSQGCWFHFFSTTGDISANIMDTCPVGSVAGWGGYWDDPGAWHPATITERHVPNAWNTMEAVYVNGSTDISISINGAGPGVIPINGAPGNLIAMAFGDEGPWGGPSYLDAIPEPATLSLLVLGGLGALIRRRR